MTVDVKDLYGLFSEAVRQLDFFNSWKKSGSRKFVKKSAGYITEVSLEQKFGSSGKCRFISLDIALRVESKIAPVLCMYGRERKPGELLYKFTARTGRGVGRPIVRADRVWKIAGSEEKARFEDEVRKTLATDVVNFLNNHKCLEDFLESIQSIFDFHDSLAFHLRIKGVEKTKLLLGAYLKSAPENRPRQELIDWCKKYSLLSESEAKTLSIAIQQVTERYVSEMQRIGQQVAK